ncbi:MAG: argininosuccinate lyase [Rhodospirillales bacterium]|nr:argininosuccinate lyase [Rhodospirillales bacterium]
MTSAPHDEVFLENARLGARSDVLIEFEEKAQFSRLHRLCDSYTLVDLAHVVMLIETGILSRERGARLLTGLLRLNGMDAKSFPWLDNSNSYLVHAEQWLGRELGEDIAGLLQTGRSRNDQDAAAERLFQRDLLIRLGAALLDLLDGVLDQAEAHADTLMPGYTHFQHAQPWTFGHYLMRQASILSRDVARLADAYPRTNLSALGGAANAGTSWPIDRRRTAELLGHDGIVVNSCDAGEFARDHIEETTACLAILASDLGRFATDLYVWHSFEFGYVEVADSLAGTSSIMPQKKNPHSLERVKSIGGQATGWLATVMGCQRPAFSTDLDFTFADDLFGRFAEVTYGVLRLMDETVRTLTVNRERMAANADAYWSTTSHLADELVRMHDISFRSAHQIVAVFVRRAIEAGLTPRTVQAKHLAHAAHESAGITTTFSDDKLRETLDGRHFVETRRSEGSVAPDQVRRHAAALRAELSERRRLFVSLQNSIESAVAQLLGIARTLAQSGDGRR